MAARRYGAVPKAVMIEPRKRPIAEDYIAVSTHPTLHRQAASPREGPKIRGPLEPTYVVWFFDAGPAQASPKLQSPRSLAPRLLGLADQSNTTVLFLYTSTRCSKWERTACAKTVCSRSCPLRTRSSTVCRWLIRTTSCAIIGP